MVLDFARLKLSTYKSGETTISDSQKFSVFEAIVEVCDSNVSCLKSAFLHVAKPSFRDIAVACEAMQIKLTDAQLLTIIDELIADPGVRFIKKIGQIEKQEKTNGIYQVNWEEIYSVV